MSSHLSKTDKHLYNVPVTKKPKREISSSTTSTFSSQLASLISSEAAPEPTSRGRKRPPSKNDIFTSHNKGSKKRAARDLEQDHSFRRALEPTDDETLMRSRRKMEEKARLYAAMKRGDYVACENEPERLVDFDRKWAENEARGTGNELEVLSSDGDDDDLNVDNGDEIVNYEDEYGRARTGTRREMERLERKRRNQLLGQEELDRMSARPVAPSKIIYGDTVQIAAFRPDDDTTYKMEDLARKRDRSATPPPAAHYAADSEMRSRGTGFFTFSKDEETRKEQMASLEKERQETERIRAARVEKEEAERIELEQQQKERREKQAREHADSFLDSLSAEIGHGEVIA